MQTFVNYALKKYTIDRKKMFDFFKTPKGIESLQQTMIFNSYIFANLCRKP